MLNVHSPHIVTVIKVCRLEWLEHVVRMDGGRTQFRHYWKANQEKGERKEDTD
jgi:hypothetical protein